MKRLQSIVKNNIKYLSVFLAIMICFGLVITMITETQTKSTLNNTENNFSSVVHKEIKDNKNDNENSNVQCTDFNIGNFVNILIKCGFAFLLGGIISERKFIVLGKI